MQGDRLKGTGEPDLRGEPVASRAEKSHHSRNLKVVLSEATKMLDILFHIIHDGVEVIFFQKDVGQADAVFFVQTLRGGFGDGHVNAHFFMQERDEFVGLNAGHEGAAGILFKHDLVSGWLTVNFHEIQGAVGHARSSSA
jgi:hypothetical protein